MREIREVDLSSFAVFGGHLSFVKAQIVLGISIPLVRIEYGIDGITDDTWGLRLDLDKAAFLDRIPDHQECDEALTVIAPILTAYLRPIYAGIIGSEAF